MGEFKPTAEIEELAQRLASLEGRDVNDVVADALRRALQGRRETPSETAARILRKLGLTPAPNAHVPLPRDVYHELEGDR